MRKHQRGSAILTALSVLVIIVSIMMMLITQQRVSIRRTQNLINVDKAYLLALGVEDWALGRLQDTLKLTEKEYYQEGWPIQLPSVEVENTIIHGQITDAQGMYNINNLRSQINLPLFSHLLHHVFPSMKDSETKALSNRIREWVTGAGSTEFSNEQFRYGSKKYKPAHQPMVSISELRMVDGITLDIYNRLASFLTALPDMTKTNLNTAPAEVLLMLSNEIDLEIAHQIVAKRIEREGYENLSDPKFDFPVKGIRTTNFTLRSKYFLIQADVSIDKVNVHLNTLVFVHASRGKTRAKVLWRSRTL